MKRTLLALALLAGCGGDDDMPAADVLVVPPDAGAADANLNCEPTAALPFEWRPVEEVSTGAVDLTTNGTGITSGTIDATAGGAMAAADNPFIYIDLETNTKVDITDVDSYTQSTWDIALKRYVLRINGGDSGPGGVEAALVPGNMLSDVTAIPSAGNFATDDWADAACELRAGMLGEPETALGGWYEYDVNTHVLSPNPYVYVIRVRDGTYRKLRIVEYYGDVTNPMRGAFYQIEWMPQL